ncbi:MAG: leucine--tRNA ligase [Mycoplasmataceae bacterium]|nr:leucine--tRNA ligase [Mycoplasmataceae bacterium]
MYNHNLVEKKWKEYWAKNKTNKFINDDKNPNKYYILDMFPYPSGSALHIGHGRSFALSDFFARYKLARGYNVLHPIGWDAFGLPSEQFAITHNKNPIDFNKKNIETFREQLKNLGFYYDYDYEIDTTDPNYYHWTQWIFAKLFENNLAILENIEVNWCEELGTVLANDEIEIKDGKMFSERGGYPVIKKPMKQWVLKITNYAELLDKGLESVDWDDSFKMPQKNWIGISEGALITFKTSANQDIEVFTTRPDTIFGVTFMAIAPENKWLKQLTTKEYEKKVNEYIALAIAKTELQRKEDKNKTGVFSGSYAINPFNKKSIPIYVSDYVLNNYATGMVMGVPAHDQRDYEFAKKFRIDISPVIEGGNIKDKAYTEDGVHINSDFLNGLNKNQAIKKIIEKIVENKIGIKKTTTKLHDWTFSRQRYWGEPFPIIFDEKNKPHLVPYDDLPVVLPELRDYRFENSGKYINPLGHAKEWVEIKQNGKKFRRETSTMPGSAGSSWYFLAYILKNSDGSYEPIDSKIAKERFKRWMPVDLYVGGTEHATGHVLYARFWHKFLHKINIIDAPEPFIKLIDHGLILAPDGRKMSKRWGNVIDPNEINKTHGSDAFRVYAAFIGPVNGTFPWNPNGLDGCRKWLDRVFNIFNNKNIRISENINDINENLNIAFNVFAKNITNNMEGLKQNLAISDMMIYINECYENKILYKQHLQSFLVCLSCFAPFVAEELNATILKSKISITKYKWPKYDKKLTLKSTINLPIQINGKLRHTIEIKKDIDEKKIIEIALKEEQLEKYIKQGYKKIIYVKNKILNFIT